MFAPRDRKGDCVSVCTKSACVFGVLPNLNEAVSWVGRWSLPPRSDLHRSGKAGDRRRTDRQRAAGALPWYLDDYSRTNLTAPARWQPACTVLVTPISGLVLPILKLCVPRSTQPDVPVAKFIVVVVVPDAACTFTSAWLSALAWAVFQI